MVDVDYAYLNARIRGMKGRLLPESTYESLMLKPDVESIITELANTAYKEEIERASIQYSGIACIEVALRQDLTRAFRKIILYTKGEEDEKYIRIILHRWDVQNIKTILRGKNIHAAPTEIHDCLVPAGELDDATLVELIKQPDVKAVIDLLATWAIEYAKPLTQNYKDYSEKRDLSLMEYALDKYYFENALALVKEDSEDDRVAREMLTTEIDVTNLKSAFKIIIDRTEAEGAEKYFVKGGYALSLNHLLALLKPGTLDGAVKQLATTPYEFLARLPDEVLRGEKVSVLEKALDDYLIRKGISRFLGDPLSISMTIGYFWAKLRETVNLRIIARMKTTEVPEKELRESLIYV